MGAINPISMPRKHDHQGAEVQITLALNKMALNSESPETIPLHIRSMTSYGTLNVDYRKPESQAIYSSAGHPPALRMKTIGHVSSNHPSILYKVAHQMNGPLFFQDRESTQLGNIEVGLNLKLLQQGGKPNRFQGMCMIREIKYSVY
ncbi:hypothetical protein AAC387_Pa01g3054 [Persea americana]